MSARIFVKFTGLGYLARSVDHNSAAWSAAGPREAATALARRLWGEATEVERESKGVYQVTAEGRDQETGGRGQAGSQLSTPQLSTAP